MLLNETHNSRLRDGILYVALLIACLATASVDGEIVGYTTDSDKGDQVLSSVVVRHGQTTRAYRASRLISCSVIHLKATSTLNIIASERAEEPDARERLQLLSDRRLNTGIINPGSRNASPDRPPVLTGANSTPGLAVRFEEPVGNRPGDDIVVFEIQRGDSPAQGDAFHVGPLVLRPGLHSIAVRAFDVSFDNPNALAAGRYVPYAFSRAVNCLSDLEELPLHAATTPGGFKALAVGIDLSDLGYEPNELAEGLFLQDADSPSAQVDPVEILGLPAPTSANLLESLPRLAAAAADQLLDEMLDGPLAEVREIVFAERIPGNDHWYANFGYYWCGQQEYPQQRLPDDWQPTPIFREGGRLCRCELRTGKVTVLLDDPRGGVRDPQVHYDGKKILFSYRPGGESHYHLYEIDIDGANRKQLTDGPWDDIEPTYLPDGGIMFCSSRCNRVVNCWRTPVATLHRCDADGKNVRVISTNIEQDNTPWVMPDGRILYMRWEYVDRNQLSFHHLWTTNPDGTGQMVFYGNQYPGTALMNAQPSSTPGKHPGISMLDAKPIPGTRKVVASFSPSHGRPEHMGAVTIVDPTAGPDDIHATRAVSRPGRLFRDPYPITEDCFLVADAQGVSVMDAMGNIQLLCGATGGDALQCHEPRPIRVRSREPVIPDQVNPAQTTGRFFVQNVHVGRNMDGVQSGDVAKLLVLEQLPKPVNFSGGPWPLTIGGSFTLARVLGTVPVEPDGSALFNAPALRSLFFVALDENDLAIKRMQSFASVQPGETIGCVGCHESRVHSPRPGMGLHVAASMSNTGSSSIPMALNSPPRVISPIADAPDVLDFPRDIQPILDRHCATCHNPEEYAGGLDLTGDHTPLFSQSYWTIIQQGLISDGRNEPSGNRPPRAIGSSASRLLQLLDGSHYDARLSDRERTIVRLWIETSATYPGTYAALGSGMHPVAFPIEVMERRCGDCHASAPPSTGRVGRGQYFQFGPGGPPLPLVHSLDDLKSLRGAVGYFKVGRSRTPQSLCNLTHPDLSLLLRAPLARSNGGLQLCKSPVFQNTEDADYQAILGAIESARQRHEVEKRFDMPGFRPNDHYLRAMRRFNVIRDLEQPVDVYRADRAYWDSFRHAGGEPPTSTALSKSSNSDRQAPRNTE